MTSKRVLGGFVFLLASTLCAAVVLAAPTDYATIGDAAYAWSQRTGWVEAFTANSQPVYGSGTFNPSAAFRPSIDGADRYENRYGKGSWTKKETLVGKRTAGSRLHDVLTTLVRAPGNPLGLADPAHYVVTELDEEDARLVARGSSAWYDAVLVPAFDRLTRGRATGTRAATAAAPGAPIWTETHRTMSRSNASRPRLANYAVVRVFYATDRKESGSEAQRARYGGDRGALTYGSCEVSMPRDHQLGQLESPSILKLEFHEDPEKHVVVLAVAKKDRQEFLREMQADVDPQKRQALVFVHGYNVSFEDAARRTAQLKYDLAFTGPAVFYSWPSQAKLSAYMVDLGNIERSEPYLGELFHLLAAQLRVDSIYLIAHSMGTRGATTALNLLTKQYGAAERSKFKEVILAAPDIDRGIFQEQILPQLKTASSRLTIYASSADKALKASWEAQGQRRLGDSTGGIFVAPGVDSIDATAVETDFLGHSYFASSRSIIRDIGALLLEGKPIQQRPLFRPVKVADGTYYVFQP